MIKETGEFNVEEYKIYLSRMDTHELQGEFLLCLLCISGHRGNYQIEGLISEMKKRLGKTD